MERAKTLIDRLAEQSKNNADVAAMLITVQLLQAELSSMTASATGKPGSGKVAIVMPSHTTMIIAAKAKQPVASAPEEPKELWTLDPIMEIPTLAHQDEIKELNEKMGQLNGESLNDRLKTNNRGEIASFLTEAPIKDLKKAIGINDRFLFLNELFRGDEDMYERSIKTINNFRILAEAQYWIERELKIKLGWDEKAETVQHFDQLIKRRFS